MLKCKICGFDYSPMINEHYVSRDNGESGIATAIKKTEGNLYDTFDCPVCGCQIIAQERKRVYNETIVKAIKEVDEDDEVQ